MDELERLKQLIGGGIVKPRLSAAEVLTGNRENRTGGPLMSDRVPTPKGSKKVLNEMDEELQKLLKEAGLK